MKNRKTTIFSIAVTCVVVLSTITAFATSAHDKSDRQNATAIEIPGGSVDYSIYEKYGLIHEKEKGYYTYQGSIVRFFNDPVVGSSFTNFFTGTVDLEAEYDKSNQLIGIKECTEEVFDMHTEKYKNSGIASMPTGTTMETGNKTDTARLLKVYEPYGITYHSEKGAWFYDNRQIGIFIDDEKSCVYSDDNGSIYLMLSYNVQNELEVKEISSQDAQAFLQDNNPDSLNFITTEENIK